MPNLSQIYPITKPPAISPNPKRTKAIRPLDVLAAESV
tara:strand:- start:523 stop:636 length:114 start_codon:yes stop_codon:yes gene_type:complete